MVAYKTPSTIQPSYTEAVRGRKKMLTPRISIPKAVEQTEQSE